MRARPTLRRVIVGVATGALMLSAAWAGTGLAPVDTPETTEVGEVETADATADTVSDAADVATDVAATTSSTDSLRVPEDPGTFHAPGTVALPDGGLEDGWYHVGAAKVNLYPNPDAYDGTWERDAAKCETLSEEFVNQLPDSADHLAAAGSPWPETPDCLYMGGFGLGPMNPIAEGVDLVKFLGDAAMLVTPAPQALAGILLDVVERTDQLAETPLRAGMARGTTLVREGDYYGPAVNMAARLTDQARPWTVLADDELADGLEERFDVARTGPLRIRGVGVRRPVRVLRQNVGQSP